jgi:hypothetical protein
MNTVARVIRSRKKVASFEFERLRDSRSDIDPRAVSEACVDLQVLTMVLHDDRSSGSLCRVVCFENIYVKFM